MFEQTFVQAQARTRKSWTVGVSFGIQAVFVGVAMILPLLHVEPLPVMPLTKPPIVVTTLYVKPMPVAQAAAPTSAIASPVTVTRVGRVFTPPNPNSALTATVNPVPIEIGDVPTIGNPSPAGLPITFGPGNGVNLPPAVRPVPPQETPRGPLRVTHLDPAKLIYSPKPLYPPIAIKIRQQGTVHLEALIATDGSIQKLRVVSGPPLLLEPALAAVGQWRYQPTVLNGVPVEVITIIDVQFVLGGN